MVKAAFDTNILIDFLRGIPDAQRELSRYEGHAISIVTWMEVMAGATPSASEGTRDFLAAFDLIDLTQDIAERAVRLRGEHRLKLPDAIVWASALARSLLLITRDERAFPGDDPSIRVPYRF